MNKDSLEGVIRNLKALRMQDATKAGARFTVTVPRERGDGKDTLPCVAWDSVAREVLGLTDSQRVLVQASVAVTEQYGRIGDDLVLREARRLEEHRKAVSQ